MIPSPDMFDKYGNCKMFWLVKIFSACLTCSLAFTCAKCWLGMPGSLHHLLYCVYTDNPWSISKSHFTKNCLHSKRDSPFLKERRKWQRGRKKGVYPKNVAERRKEGKKRLKSKWLQSWRPLKNLGWDRCVSSWLINKSFRVWNYYGKKQPFLFVSHFTIYNE